MYSTWWAVISRLYCNNLGCVKHTIIIISFSYHQQLSSSFAFSFRFCQPFLSLSRLLIVMVTLSIHFGFLSNESDVSLWIIVVVNCAGKTFENGMGQTSPNWLFDLNSIVVCSNLKEFLRVQLCFSRSSIEHVTIFILSSHFLLSTYSFSFLSFGSFFFQSVSSLLLQILSNLLLCFILSKPSLYKW